MTYLLGIDVGTTRTAAAICRPGAREAEIVNLGDRSSAVPSVLFLGTDGSVLVGDSAERRALTDPDRVVREFKRRIGDPTPLNVGGRAWSAEELAARLVRWVIDRVAEREGGPAARVAVTHPASWGTLKKDLLGAALAAQGVTIAFLAEPQAAAVHYASSERVERGSTIAVYDLGGGTFDAAVVHKDGSAGFALVGRPEGLERLGGIDFDQAVFDHVRAGMPGAFDDLDEADPEVLSAVARIRRDCTEAKEALSADTEVSIPVLLPDSRGSVRLHRSEFEALIQPQVEETVAALRKAIASAGITPEQLSAVLLVGGSSRIPLIAQLVSEQLGRPVAVDADPKNVIAKGAALALTPQGVSATGGTPAHRPAGGSGATPAHRPPVGTGPAPHHPRPGHVVATGVGHTATPPPPRPAASNLHEQLAAPAVPRPPARASGGRSAAALIMIGGLFAAVLVLAALLLLPRSEAATSAQDESPTGTQAPSFTPAIEAPSSGEDRAPEVPHRTQRPSPVRPAPPVTTPPPSVTTAPTTPPTTVPTTPPTTAPTSEPTTSPTTEPTTPPSTEPAGGGGGGSDPKPGPDVDPGAGTPGETDIGTDTDTATQDTGVAPAAQG